MEPMTRYFIPIGRLFQQEIKMRNVVIAACCAALLGSVSVISSASAQTTGPATQDSMKTNSPMNSHAKMMKKKMMKKKMMKKKMMKNM